jgi:5-methylcytosine-specific restriction endonuclease McrA
MNTWSCLVHLSDHELLAEVKTLAARERKATANLIASLMEMDSRRLYLGEGCSSLFTYCTHVLQLSEHAAYGRIEAARAARRFPIILDLLEDGSITLTTVCLVAPHLMPDNHRAVLDSARHKSKREVEVIVAALRPQPPVVSMVRKLPAPQLAQVVDPQSTAGAEEDDLLYTASASATRPCPAIVRPLASEIYKVQFTMSREMHDRLREAQNLLRHVFPNGDPAAIFDRALSLLLKELQKSKHAATGRPREQRSSKKTSSRRVPARIKRQVWARDGGQCAFVGVQGRCIERGLLEYHHLVPYAAGGQTTSENLSLRCKAHNHHEAELFFGPPMVKEARGEWAIAARSGPG